MKCGGVGKMIKKVTAKTAGIIAQGKGSVKNGKIIVTKKRK